MPLHHSSNGGGIKTQFKCFTHFKQNILKQKLLFYAIEWQNFSATIGTRYCFESDSVVPHSWLMWGAESDGWFLLNREHWLVRMTIASVKDFVKQKKQQGQCFKASCVVYVLQRCKRHDQERAAAWPQETTLQQKLYGDVEDPRRTTTFIVDTGVVM